MKTAFIGSIVFTTGLAISTNVFSAEGEDASVLEEIVVTGLKRDASILTTPASISALGAEELSAKGISDISEIQYLVPSLQYGEFLGRRQVAIRGIGEFVDAPGVMVSIDGVVQAIASSSQLAQLDLVRVEVLRGPQGTLYGRNATGGTINFISARPTDELSGHIKASYAEYEHATLEGVISGPIGDKAGFRLAANFLDAGEGWIKNLMPGETDLMMGEKSNLRLTLTADLKDTVDATFMYGRSEMNGPWDHHSMIVGHYDLGTASGLPPIDTSTTPPSDVLFTEEPWKIYSKGPVDSDREYDVASLELNWAIGEMNLKSITAKQTWFDQNHISADGTSVGLFQRTSTAEHDTFTQEINLSGVNGNLDWIVGLYYMDDDREASFFFDFPIAAFGFPFANQFDFQQPFFDTTSKSAFVDATWTVSERVRIGAGIRTTDEEKREAHNFAVRLKFPGMGPVEVVRFCGPGVFAQEWNESENTIRASVEYDLNDTSMVYTTYSEGFKVGGVNGSECAPPWRPETVDAFEMGLKASLLDGASDLTVALFHYDYSDFQVAQVIGIQGSITNAGDAEIDGLEIEMSSILNENWSINGGLTLLDSAYGPFLNTDTLRAELGVLENEGNPLNYAPDTSLNIGITYETPLETGGYLTMSLDASYRSRVYYREFDQKGDSTDPYTIFNFNVNWNSSDDLYAGRLFVRNLTDKDYVANIQGSNTTYGRQGTWNMPRQIGVEFTRFFGQR